MTDRPTARPPRGPGRARARPGGAADTDPEEVAGGRGRGDRRADSWVQATVSLLAGVLASLPLLPLVETRLWPLAVWDVTVAVYLTWVWRISWPCDAARTRRLASREDPSRRSVDLLLWGAALVSLGGVALALLGSVDAHSGARATAISLGTATAVLSWALVHTLFALTYARLYYTGRPGGIDFKQDTPPAYSDFAYLAFTVGTSFATSDPTLTDTTMRKAVLAQCLLSFVFGTVILAVVVSLIPSLVG
ncbi:DUF1345 domain-containing protein [Geodermatophilus sp. TF02-6]|uniref:DUF1345 domain-containing protein n=1 Tax=Geodermatophilus sp. TF02-6 TaxID=2250575 RepID=UPI001314A3D8|nr:DUF1345 domain-containing protein [Geodermatophilus sp. TF02-6]